MKPQRRPPSAVDQDKESPSLLCYGGRAKNAENAKKRITTDFTDDTEKVGSVKFSTNESFFDIALRRRKGRRCGKRDVNPKTGYDGATACHPSSLVRPSASSALFAAFELPLAALSRRGSGSDLGFRPSDFPSRTICCPRRPMAENLDPCWYRDDGAMQT
jgi:hypothetical protein